MARTSPARPTTRPMRTSPASPRQKRLGVSRRDGAPRYCPAENMSWRICSQTYNNSSNDVLQAFKDQHQDAAPDEPRTIWQLDRALTATPGMDADRIVSFGRVNMVHTGQLPPFWPFLDDPTNETLTSSTSRSSPRLVTSCAPNALVQISFVILRTLLIPSQDPRASRESVAYK